LPLGKVEKETTDGNVFYRVKKTPAIETKGASIFREGCVRFD